MLTRREAVLAAPAVAAGGGGKRMELCLHQTTSAAAGYRQSLEGYAKAGIRLVEVIPPRVEEFARKEGMAAARRLLSDLGLRAVSSGGVRGLAEPHEGRAKALEELKARAPMIAEMGVDRMVCPCGTTGKFTLDDYRRGADNLREAGEIVKPYGITAMLEFMRGSTFAGTLETALELTRQAAHPNVRPMFDFYHFWAGLSRLEDLELIRPGEIHHVHFQDVPKMPRELLDNGTREMPGDGVSPLVPILRALRRKGYGGPLSVELFYPRLQQADPYQVAMEIRRKAEPILRRAGVA
ncbi:MAG: sugar phosphate isomerase/epimerase [Candidatus Solibacter usitatus]|nr:sugar phosphate isomerase/epimerase [Candidatus Solibacter usitatus]